MPPLLTLVVAPIINLLLAAFAKWRRMVTMGGAIAGFVLGTLLILLGGWFSWLEMGAFFLTSSLLSRIGTTKKRRLAAMTEKGDNRDAMQVIANGGVGLIGAVLYAMTGNSVLLAAIAASFAEANADTWSTELGVLSRKPPVLITTGKPIEPGRSGGVSPAGTLSAFGGALVVALVYAAGALSANGWNLDERIIVEALLVVAAGAMGSIIDSVLGATVQMLYRDADSGVLTERRRSLSGKKNTQERGLRGIDNDVVNVGSCAVAAVLAGVLVFVLR